MTLLRDANCRLPREVLLKWPTHLSSPSELMRALKERTRLGIMKSPIYSKIVLQAVGSMAYILAHFMNKTQVFNHEVFKEELKKIELQNRNSVIADIEPMNASPKQKSPLITFSNHISCIDDPVIWASLLPFSYYATQTESVRWSAAAVEICFSKPWHSTFFSLGKTFPIIRGEGIKQPAMDFALALLKYNQWLHLFPEGRVMRDENQKALSNKDRGYIFKWGISKLILDYLNSSHPFSRSMRILPFYHLGMDEILPVGRPYVPKAGKRITILIRPSVIVMNTELLSSILNKQSVNLPTAKSKSNDDIIRIKLTNFLEEQLEKLSEQIQSIHKKEL